MDLVEKELSYTIRGAVYEVSHQLGNGFLEAVYQEAMEIELRLRGLNIDPQKKLKIHYKGVELQCEYIPDIIVEDKVIIELKAVSAIDDNHRSQIINYLKATGKPLGLLVNFGTKTAEVERFVNQKQYDYGLR